MMVSPTRRDLSGASKRQKLEEGHEKNVYNTREVPRSFAGVFYGDDEDDDSGPLVFRRSSLTSKLKGDILKPAAKKDVSLISDRNKVSKLAKLGLHSPVVIQKVATTTSASFLSAAHSDSNPSLYMARDSHLKQSKLTAPLPPIPFSGERVSTSSTLSYDINDNENPSCSISPNPSGPKITVVPGSFSSHVTSTLNSKGSGIALNLIPSNLLLTSSNQPKHTPHGNTARASHGTSISQSLDCRSMEHGLNSSRCSTVSNLAKTKDSAVVTSVPFVQKGSSKYEEEDGDSIKNKPLATKLVPSTGEILTAQAATRLEFPSKRTLQMEEDSGSEDDKPLSERLVSSRNVRLKNDSRKLEETSTSGSLDEGSEDSDDHKPLVQRLQLAAKNGMRLGTSRMTKDSVNKKPLSQERMADVSEKSQKADEQRELSSTKRPLGQNTSSSSNFSVKKPKVSEQTGILQLEHKPEAISDEEHEVPLAKLIPSSHSKIKPVIINKVLETNKMLEARRRAKLGKTTKASAMESHLSFPKGEPVSGGSQKWTTLEHNGVIFPPPYQPHGIKILYNGKPVELTSPEEEVATMFAVMKDTDYVTKQKFLSNFWSDWKHVLGSNHIIKKLELCDFTPISEWHLTEKEKKKSMSAEEKKRIKEEKLKLEEKYMWALVDGVKEKVGNFRVEPPGLFRGRGEHPKMGKLKKRIFPEDIVINVGKDAPVPECPLPGHRWKEIRHDNTVTWLAYWNDPINTKEFKYVFLAPSSSLKGQSDKEKYEKSRKLKEYIEDIRRTYTRGFSSSDPTTRQIAVATYLIDRLALRAGNEKDDDEADTVGCCSLKVEHVSLVPPHSLEFDFLGKDSIRYFNTVEVDERVYKAIGDFKKAKKEGKDLFDKLDTSKLNTHLKEIMPGLTAKVFRTYNASITLDTQLQDTNGHIVTEKIAAYQGANKEVAILCNHQRSISKSHSAQMERLESKMAELQALRTELKRDLDRAKKGKPPLQDADGKAKRNQTPEALQKKLDQTSQKIKKMELDMRVKDDLKTVALGTSKINYMDPRITVAWCKLHEVPIEKIFNKSLLAKFSWAMCVEPDFRF